MLEKIKKFREYLDYVEEHYNNVQKAWSLINEKCQNKGFRFIYDDYIWYLIDEAVKSHDESKLSAEEFTQYRQFFFPCENEKKDKELFDLAWEHHKKHNSHHWQTWTTEYIKSPYADAFLVLNVIDWVAMGFKFGDTARDYYEKNKSSITMPDWAVQLMYDIFACIYPKTETYGGVQYQVIECGIEMRCEDCDLRDTRLCCDAPCVSSERHDKKDVYFKKITS